jgi:hypothetical protein
MSPPSTRSSGELRIAASVAHRASSVTSGITTGVAVLLHGRADLLDQDLAPLRSVDLVIGHEVDQRGQHEHDQGERHGEPRDGLEDRRDAAGEGDHQEGDHGLRSSVLVAKDFDRP